MRKFKGNRLLLLDAAPRVGAGRTSFGQVQADITYTERQKNDAKKSP